MMRNVAATKIGAAELKTKGHMQRSRVRSNQEREKNRNVSNMKKQ